MNRMGRQWDWSIKAFGKSDTGVFRRTRQRIRRRPKVESLESRRLLAVATLLTESFEHQDLAELTSWTFETSGSGTVSLDHRSAAVTGDSSLRLDVANDGVPSTSAAMVHLDVTSQKDVTGLTFEFWMKRLNHIDDDRFYLQVDVSRDGLNWLSLSPRLQGEGNVWHEYQFDLGRRLSEQGMSLTGPLIVRFEQSAVHSTHDLLIDSVRVQRTTSIEAESDTVDTSLESLARLHAMGLEYVPGEISAAGDERNGSVATAAAIGEVSDAPLEDDLAAIADGSATLSDLMQAEAEIALVLTVDRSVVSEQTGPGAAVLTVTREGAVDADLSVSLDSNNHAALTVPASIVIPAGQVAATFEITTQNDYQIDGDQLATVKATATGYADSAVVITVQDDDSEVNRTIGGTFSGVLPSDRYVATFDVNIPTGEVWSLSPGTSLLFDPGVRLNVEGSLIADGELASPIRFLSSRAGSEQPGDWVGIVIQGVSQPESLLEYVEIAYAENGVLMENRDPGLVIRNSNIHHHQFDGIAGRMGPAEFISRDVRVESSEIHSNLGNGIALSSLGKSGEGSSSANPTIVGNEIHQNVGRGISIHTFYTPISNQSIESGSASPLIAKNRVHHNAVGIEAIPHNHGGLLGSTSVSAEVYNNIIDSNSGDAILLGGGTRAYNSNRILNNTVVLNGGTGLSHSANSAGAMLVQNNLFVSNAVGINASAAFVPSARQVAFNDVFGNSSGNWINYPAGFGVASTINATGTPSDSEFNISVDPLFVVGTLYEVVDSSPINDAGSSNGQPYDDLLGRLRDAPYDMGVYEHDFVTNIVTTLIDEDDGALGLGSGNSLREIIKATNSRQIPDTIAFDPALLGGTIVLNGTKLPALTDTVTIQGPGAGMMIIRGNGTAILEVGNSVSAEISGLTLREANGGAVINYGSLVIRDTVIRDNNSASAAGIYSSGSLLLERSTISGNQATNSSGGGIFVYGVATIVDSTIDNNFANNQGGGIYNNGTISIFNSTLSGNRANFHGGAIAQSATNNTARLVNVTVTGNRSDANADNSGNGGGIYGGSVQLHNSLIAANFRGVAPFELGSVTLIDPSSHNLIGDSATAGGLMDGVDSNLVGRDPRLGPLGDHGGPTRTHSLLIGSPAIDAGDTTKAINADSNPLTWDQRGPGFSRVIDGNGSATAEIDIGAWESKVQLPLIQSIVTNEGSLQRSSLKTLRVTFNTVVTIDQTTSDPFGFIDVATGDAILDSTLIRVVDGRTVVDFTFNSGPHVDGGGSLVDGRYRLTIDAGRIAAFGLNLDGNQDGLVGGNRVFGDVASDRFFRKYGDQNGNETVDLLDFADFRRTFGLLAGASEYLDSLDSNYNGAIDLLDFAAFRRNFGS